MPKHPTITENNIGQLVDTFYARIRTDPVLGPVFENKIAPDAWPKHLATMKRFWSSVMLTSGAYSGNPVGVHRGVPGLERPMFAHWLTLFGQSQTHRLQPGAGGFPPTRQPARRVAAPASELTCA
jgi:hemoglobin